MSVPKSNFAILGGSDESHVVLSGACQHKGALRIVSSRVPEDNRAEPLAMCRPPPEVARVLQVVQEGDMWDAIGIQKAGVNVQERIAGVEDQSMCVGVLLRHGRVQFPALDVPPLSVARVQLHVVPA